MNTETAPPPEFEIIVSRHFASWLAEQKISLAFTTPPLKFFLIGLKPDGQLSIFERTFDRCLGLAVTDNTLYLSTRHQLWRLESSLLPGQLTEDGYDRQYIPRLTYTTGFLGIHDVAIDKTGRVIFVNTRFGCLATISEQYNFIPLWHPPFLSNIIPGDRCHLNGLAMRDGHPAYVTSVSQTDEFDSWRDHRHDGGVVTDISTGEIVVSGLSMPHSPRWHQGQLWLTNSGTGQIGRVDLKRGSFEPIAFAPGFLRGLCFSGNYAIVGSSKPRHGNLYSGLALDDELKRRNQEARLGLFIIDLRTGQIVHWLFIETSLRELYDVITLPGVRQPMALGLVDDEIQKTIFFDPKGFGYTPAPTPQPSQDGNGD